MVFLALLFLCAGCATHAPQIIARRGPVFRESARRVALMPQPQLSDAELRLRQNVGAALAQRGFEIVSNQPPELTLVCHIEKNWKTTTRTETRPVIFQSPSMIVSPGIAPPAIHYGNQFYSEQVEDSVGLTGIRLQFYDSANLRAKQFEIAWEGYIGAGLQLDPEEELKLIDVLLGYFGRDFVGRAQLKD